MKYFIQLCLSLATLTSALSITSPFHKQSPLKHEEPLISDRYLVELSPGETRWITEDDKWALLRDGRKFMDITESGHTYPFVDMQSKASVKYPSKTAHNKTVRALSEHLDKKSLQKHLEGLTSFHTRYYKSQYGIDAAQWLFDTIHDVVNASGAFQHNASLHHFHHPWGQFSIIARFPGKTNHTVVIGAHLDSINMFLPSILAAPGADDDGSGTVTILEALTALLHSDDIVTGQAENTIEFHWYSAEEGGLLGSQAIFKSYFESGKEVKAMIQQDMTGYVEQTLAHGKPESVGVITDFVSPELTEFIKEIITTYCDIPYTLTKCGYACSDHASASKYGFPSAFVIESDFEYSDKKIHTTDDVIKYLSFDHMLQHAKMTLGFAYEAAFAKL
ncbi:hypothetical protein PV10_07663 [Exophiala mesophila]|uniref:Peptide hydrolase n=1 Tax=Exophiala mesophila TaxID=212818 RepID=A0A0D1XQH3_EXOME|nr:uncharacterized protein PV10_07663 [Exophiala mesophila]KIV90351.1 hypothetical protein PV10_07663 [Exophiala mesophila]